MLRGEKGVGTRDDDSTRTPAGARIKGHSAGSIVATMHMSGDTFGALKARKYVVPMKTLQGAGTTTLEKGRKLAGVPELF